MDAKKKIGILTFHRAINYGAVLQAFALQSYLKHQFSDATVEFIDFYESQVYQSASWRGLNYSPFYKKLIYFLLHKFRRTNRRVKKFKLFSETRLLLSDNSWTDSNKDLFLHNPPVYDCYITGSDQVFNPNNKNLQVNYLGFYPVSEYKKIAYAASIGVSEIPDDKKTEIVSYLKDFSKISCREKNANLLVTRLGFESQVTVDPVFLLDSVEWSNSLSLEKIKLEISGGFIFVYDLNGGNNLLELAKRLSVLTGLPICCLTFNLKQRYNVKKVFYTLSPEEFLAYLSRASYVVTDSFHGTALSINFRKDFFTYLAAKKLSTRIVSLLETVNLEDRILNLESDFPANIRVEYTEARLSRLKSQIEDSKLFLLENI